MITDREPSEKFFETSLKIGFAILIVLMVFVFYNDIPKTLSLIDRFVLLKSP